MNELMTILRESFDSFDDVRLSEVNAYIKQNTLEFVFVCPEGSEVKLGEMAGDITAKISEILKVAFKIKVKFKKSYFEEAYFTYAMLGFFEKYPMIKHNVKSGNFSFEYGEANIKVILEVPSAISDYIVSRNILDEIDNFIRSNYCQKIEVELRPVELDEDIIVEESENKFVYDFEGGRKIKVSNVEPFIGDPIYERPGYVVDAHVSEGVVLCGYIREFTERKRAMKEGETEQKYFFKFRLEDFTGSIDCIYFPTKKSLDKIRLLRDGKAIVAFGSVENNTYNGVTKLSYKVRFISLCTMPSDFVINRTRMVVPDEYRFVRPQPYENYEQDNIFSVKEKTPPYLMGKEFVVYDFETTGLNHAADRIIEVGAVKIEDGVITESFSTMVDPECLIPEKITLITGIKDSDVKGAPTIRQALPDFFKFCYGAIMVGQNNLQFDWQFLRAKAEPLNIFFDNEQLDIMVIAQKYHSEFGKFNLDYLSKKFGIVNEKAHRAVFDAITTAKIFIKLAADLN